MKVKAFKILYDGFKDSYTFLLDLSCKNEIESM